MEATKSFFVKRKHYRNKSLHWSPTLNSIDKFTQFGNKTGMNILFITPIVIAVQGDMFEIYTMVSEIHDNVD